MQNGGSAFPWQRRYPQFHEVAEGIVKAPKAVILLLISDPLMRVVLRDALHSGNYQIITANNLGDAVSRLKEIHADLLITRTYIESMAGHMAADYLRTKQPGLPVLIVSGFMDDDRVRDQNAIEQFYVFPEPFGRSQLLDKVATVFDVIRKS